MKEIKIVFYANVEEKDYDSVAKAFRKCGAEIINSDLPELKNVGCFEIHEVETGKKIL